MIVLPTGLGKSAVIALAPFCLGASRVLCILPSLILAEQLTADLKESYHEHHPIGRTGVVKATVERFETKRAIPEADVVVTNIRAPHPAPHNQKVPVCCSRRCVAQRH